MNDRCRTGWLIDDLPAYQGDNNLSNALYDCGTYVKQYGEEDCKSTIMQSITSTSLEEFMAYIDLLKHKGYREESYLSMENNLFYRFIGADKRVSVNYYANEEKAIVILDANRGVGTADISYTYEPKDDEHTEIYMFGLKMDPDGMNIAADENTSGYVNNGECLIVKCADNSVIIVDGGAECQMKTEDQKRFLDLLYKITGKSENEMITVSAWIITHFHNDHVMGFNAVLLKNKGKFEIERVICNMPSPEVTNRGNDGMFINTANVLKNEYPSCQDIKVHTGDVIKIADVTLTIVYTHEDMADEEGAFPTKDFNATSTVIMLETRAGMRFLITGDITSLAEDTLCKHFSEKTLKCDILQQPHHNFNNNSTIYEVANAQVMLMIQSSGGLIKNEEMTTHSDLAKKWCDEWYCGGDETVGFTYKDNKAKLIYRATNIYNQ